MHSTKQYFFQCTPAQLDACLATSPVPIAPEVRAALHRLRQNGLTFADALAGDSTLPIAVLDNMLRAWTNTGKVDMTTRDERKKSVAQMNANFAIEGLEPDPHDKALQKRYIDGKATIEDLLKHAEEAAALAKAKQK